jgi:hypothetical protein
MRRPSELQEPSSSSAVCCTGKPIERAASQRQGRHRPSRMPYREMSREKSTDSVEVLVLRARKALVEQSTGVTIEVVRCTGYRLRMVDET